MGESETELVIVAVEPVGYFGEEVEGCVRVEGLEAEFVEAVINEVTAFAVGLVHGDDVIVCFVIGDDARVLNLGRWCGHDGLVQGINHVK